MESSTARQYCGCLGWPSTAATSPPIRAQAPARVSFSATLTDSMQLRAATVELTQRARAAANAP
jgi:hypothetical protein